MIEGTIKRLISDRGFGFIHADGLAKDVFFHLRALRGVAFEDLSEGARVRLVIRDGDRGPMATRVEVTADTAPAPDTEPSRDGYRFYNPYNFVRFLRPPAAPGRQAEPAAASGQFAALAKMRDRLAKTPSPDDAVARGLLGRCPPPPHDRAVGLSGRIRCTLTAVTPLFVSDSEGVKPDTAEERKRVHHKSYRFYRHDGRPAIPASSLRGMIRSLFEAATNSCMILMDGERHLTRHILPAQSLRLIPARVVKDGEDWSLELYRGNTPLAPGDRPNGAQYAAWVPRYLGRMIWQSGNTTGPSAYASRTNIEGNLRDLEGRECWALLRRYTHPRRHFDFYSVADLAGTRDGLRAPRNGEIVGHGYLHITNQNIENKHDERFFFVREGEEPVRMPLPGDVIEKYETLIRDYQDTHADEKRRRERAGEDPGEPSTGDRDRRRHKAGLSRHVIDAKALRLTQGTTVYALIDDPGGPDDIRFLVPVAMPRVFFDAAIEARLPFAADAAGDEPGTPGDLSRCTDHDRLCPACRTFGWVASNADEADDKRPLAYAGRLRFGVATLNAEAETMEPVALAILSAPKPTAKRFYLARGDGHRYEDAGAAPAWNEQAATNAWDEDNFVRGRKLYRHHHPERQLSRREYRRAQGRTDDQNRTVQDALAPGARFAFEIAFENLAELELGALLWTLELDGKACHRLGYGKPLGFGSVRIGVDELALIDSGERYASVHPKAGWQAATDKKEELIGAFESAMASVYPEGRDGFDKLPNIADILTLLSESAEDLPIHYPRTGEKPDPDGKNFEWFMANKRGTGFVLRRPGEDKGLPLLSKPPRRR